MVSWSASWGVSLGLPAARRSNAYHERIFNEFWALGGQKSAATAAAECSGTNTSGPAEELR